MKKRVVKIAVEKTIQVESYEPLKVLASIEATLDDNEDYHEVATQMRNDCRVQVEEELIHWMEK